MSTQQTHRFIAVPAIVAALVLSLTATAHAATVQIGPGADLASATNVDTPGEDRLNIERDALALTAGTYDVLDFQLYVDDHTQGGTITPMLLSGAPSSYTTLWVGGAFNPTSDGQQTAATYAPGSETFTLFSAGSVYAGVFTQAGGAAIIGFAGGGGTDHDNSYTAPTGAGQSVTGISNTGLGRSYAFEINIDDGGSTVIPTIGTPVVSHESDTAPDGPAAGTPYTPSFASGGPSSSDLINGLSPFSSSGGFTNEGSTGTPALTDGTFDTFYGVGAGTDDHTAYASAGAGEAVTYDLGDNYDLTEIVVYGGWIDGGRDQQNAEVLVSVDGVTFVSLGSTSGNLGTPSTTAGARPLSHRNSFVDAGAGVLAFDIQFVRVDFGGVENGWTGYAEIDVFGNAAAAIPTPAALPAGLALIALAAARRRRK